MKQINFHPKINLSYLFKIKCFLILSNLFLKSIYTLIYDQCVSSTDNKVRLNILGLLKKKSRVKLLHCFSDSWTQTYRIQRGLSGSKNMCIWQFWKLFQNCLSNYFTNLCVNYVRKDKIFYILNVYHMPWLLIKVYLECILRMSSSRLMFTWNLFFEIHLCCFWNTTAVHIKLVDILLFCLDSLYIF